MSSDTEHSRIIIYDGVCHFCNRAVNFIIRHDSQAKFCFVPMQSEVGKELTSRHETDDIQVDTILLIKQGQTYIRSSAALEIAKELDGYWHLFRAFRIVPTPLRHWLYRMVANNRYKLYGKHDSCIKPSEEVRERFLGI